jgi:NitT/TauT family transport system ATP-binding protein
MTVTTLKTAPPPAMELRAAGVTLGYAARPVLTGLDLHVRPGEILVIFGHSGCGKSTLLRGLAGLLPVAGGQLLADGAPVTGTSPDRAVVFQDDALLPWRTARANVELPLAIRGVPRAQRRKQATRWLAQVGLAGQEDRLPRELSGGMRQRVQLARTLAGQPRAILMDEPFGSLDAQTRAAMQRLLIEVWDTTPTTVVFVTHDVDEALFVGDRVAVLRPGGIEAAVTVPHPREPGAARAPRTAAARARLLALLSGQDPAAGPAASNGAGDHQGLATLPASADGGTSRRSVMH